MLIILARSAICQDTRLVDDAKTAMRTAAEFYSTQVASHGGYVYYYTLDLKKRWGEGEANADQIWVQPPGTPTVGLAYLKAYDATGDQFYLDAATAAAEALIYGQLKSGGWTNCIDFNPRGKKVADYRNAKGGGKNNSSLDDGQTQTAIQLMVRADLAHRFKHKAIHETARIALDALLAAQFANGGFPQVWTGPVDAQPITPASFPSYDWRTEGRIKNYWDMYTLNDGLAGTVATTLEAAYEVYGDERFKQALTKLGDFLILAQLPDPQPAWAQQYSYDMHPIWARRFEPPAITGSESQDVIATLMQIYRFTGDKKYLEPIPRAMAYLETSKLPDGRLARYYELETNTPLYMNRRQVNGKWEYFLTYDDTNLPDHYGWKVSSKLDRLKKEYETLVVGKLNSSGQKTSAKNREQEVRKIIGDLDDKGRWVSQLNGRQLPGDQKFTENDRFLGSDVFSRNLEMLSDYVASTRSDGG
ncbi:MAG: pectic acid lyase [Planctomycetota bacterium]|nr:pectic acid lyase [Planctomycetota bacterium]